MPPGAPGNGRVPPQRYRADGPPVTQQGGAQRPPYSSGDMPLLTHDETGATSVAREGALAVAERTEVVSGAPGMPQKPARKGSPWQRVRRILYVLLGLAVIGPLLAFVIGWMIFPVPSSDEAALTQVATFTFADDQPLATVRPENVNRVRITLDKVPLQTRQAVVATEDNTFYSNPGFDITGIMRAVYNQVTGGIGGGSTITQQYIKVSSGHDENSLWRKYKEVVLAVKISREQTKDQILENYLNTIYLGRGAYGIQAAAKAYFNKDVGQLTVSESAMIAGIIQSPSNWDPAKNLDNSKSRWTVSLDRMVENGWLSPAERAQQTFPTNWLPEPPSSGGMPSDDRYHIYEKAVQELATKGITQDQIDTEGLTITTTVQQQRQAQAVDAIKKVMKGQPDNLRTALVSVDPKTGAILAYYGGANGLGTDYANAMRQPGSSFKPFVLAAALQSNEGIGLGSLYDGSSPQVFEGQSVSNSEGFNCDSCTVQTAMTKSINTIFYRMAVDVGTQRVADAAHQAGIPSDVELAARGGIALGDSEVHPVDMASAFATFADDGERHEPYIVSKVVAADGRVLFDRGDAAGEQAIPQQVARNVTESMIDVASSSRIALSDGRPVASKTGTVQLNKTNQNKDAWTVGYTPSISTAVWVGSDLSDPIKNSAGQPIFGRMLPGSIWQEFMNNALRGTPKEQFSKFVPMGVPPAADPALNPNPSGSLSPSGTPGDGSDENDGRGRGNGNGRGNSDDDSNGNSDDESDSGFGDGGLFGSDNGNGNSNNGNDNSDSGNDNNNSDNRNGNND
ncbi:transglycosylase domain-containing protein [Pseudonocardia sp. CA-142604]|uniref:transglycosylase domain-containing protein n=1 Tax=Pseudonocardia sp. CA-142604 TaxID=3240024 RepID=UPI003D933C37